ncbi:MAG TPA: nuclear transport factor 2 family protein [Thermomicrobiales bacterium]|nr:nuclear transport factor 2 family protein [Thermomicrobiales bacterium]
MATTPQAGTQMFDAMKAAFETSDAKALAAMYDDQAVIEVINQNAPPKNPRRIAGKDEIARYLVDVCGRNLQHHFEEQLVTGDHAAYLERCIYPDGVNVLSESIMTMRDGRILRQTTIEAWDQ